MTHRLLGAAGRRGVVRASIFILICRFSGPGGVCRLAVEEMEVVS